MTYTFRPAKRENVSLLVGIAGGTGSGKTFSAMRLASGMANGARFAVIDTENGRARHYADQFDFDYVDLRAPFRPDAYADAIDAAAKAGYPVIVVDSMSHEWDGDGGCLDWQEEEMERLGNREAMKMLSWQQPKKSHRKMVTRLLQVNAHVILCFRAQDKIEMVKEGGKTVVRPKRSLTGLDGWIPISEPRLPFELTLSVLMTADAPGVPKPIKLQDQHKAAVPLDRPITEQTGTALAAWASGAGTPKAGAAEEAPTGPAASAVITKEQQHELVAAAQASGLDGSQARAIIERLTGQTSSAGIPADRFDEVLAEMSQAVLA